MVDYLVSSPLADRIAARIEDAVVSVPAHFDAGVLSALGRLHRAGELTEKEVEARVALTTEAPFQRHHLAPLLEGAWSLHHNVRLVDALYVELVGQLGAVIVTTDPGMASASAHVDFIE